MVEACRPEVLIDGRRNRSRDAAHRIRCRAVVRRMHHTVLALVSNEVPDHRGARQHYLRIGLLADPAIPEINPAGHKLAQLPAAGEDSLT